LHALGCRCVNVPTPFASPTLLKSPQSVSIIHDSTRLGLFLTIYDCIDVLLEEAQNLLVSQFTHHFHRWQLVTPSNCL